MKRLWRRERNGEKVQKIKESEQRLKETQDRWPEVRRAQRDLDRMIERALRGGAT